jgi:bifunctional non-homologous end joining protein LigD
MALEKYRHRRSFDSTPEPANNTLKSSTKQLHFVVQKHSASQLHYDFRLELAGVLKSWAVPRGPSLNPHDRRLAILTEDHPLAYRTFKGVIPKGNYGAGSVKIWDQGTYQAIGNGGLRQQQAKLQKGLNTGHLTFVLAGKKLKGEFALIRLNRDDEKSWLLIKKADEYASGFNTAPS